jgi:hypothetical protein
MHTDAEKHQEDRLFHVVLWKKARMEILARPVFYASMLALILLLSGLFYWPISISRSGKLTDLEQVLFQLFLVALSAVLSWSLAKRAEERNVLASQKSLARSAVRRIGSIGAAAGRLKDTVERRKTEIRSDKLWAEIETPRRALLFELFDGISHQVAEMRDNIAASEDDWLDILPEEFAKRQQAEQEILKEREVAIEEMGKAYAELLATLQKGEARTSEQISALNAAIAKQVESVEQRLSVKVEQIRSALPSSLNVSYGFSNPLTPWESPQLINPWNQPWRGFKEVLAATPVFSAHPSPPPDRAEAARNPPATAADRNPGQKPEEPGEEDTKK